MAASALLLFRALLGGTRALLDATPTAPAHARTALKETALAFFPAFPPDHLPGDQPIGQTGQTFTPAQQRGQDTPHPSPIQHLSQDAQDQRDSQPASSTPLEIAALPESSSHGTASSQRGGLVRLAPGVTVSAIVRATYGSDDALAFDLVREFNPHITDLDQTGAGETLWFPPRAQDTLVRRQPDGSYLLVLKSFFSFADAQQYVRTVQPEDYTVNILPRDISASQTLYRVQLQGLLTRKDAQQAWKFLSSQTTMSAMSAM